MIVKVDDFVKSSLDDFFCGFVVDIVTVCDIDGFLVELANGKRDFLPLDYTLVFVEDRNEIHEA